MRRKGQSLEFREFMQYTPGDDFRYIDWRASARQGGAHQYVVRSFTAEEQLRVVVSIDTRETMAYPVALPKLLLARWLVEALCRVAFALGDQIFVHRPFDPRQKRLALVNGELRMRQQLAELMPRPTAEARANLAPLRPILGPTTVWVIVTDEYFPFDDGVRALARMMAERQGGYCWVILVELDSWPFEKALLREGAWQILGPGAAVAPPIWLDAGGDALAAVTDRIEQNKRQFEQLTRLAPIDILRWRWLPGANAEELFNHEFFNSRLRHIFVKQTI